MHGKIGKTGSMALKLDMNKAFDKGEWSCLEKIMTKMGFHSRWISMVMSYVLLSHTLFALMVSLEGILPQLGVCVKGIISLHICFCYVQKVF